MTDSFALSVVLPCLNEKAALKNVLQEIKDTCDPLGIPYEIVVADNGSTDGSAEEAARLGARVVPVEKRGYGSAVNGGILAAKGKIVVFGDADGSYPFCEIPRLIKPIEQGTADLVLGNRLSKQLSKEAMPWLHRYIGTPALSFLLRFLHGIDVFDCNGGLRALRRDKYEELKLKQPGMEYASEMLIRAGQCGWKYQEISILLRPAAKTHVPHLRTFRDGFRHLRTIVGSCFYGVNVWKNIGLLLLFMVLCGCYGLLQGKDANWDLMNYHLYNPFALFTGRFGQDMMPAGIHTFLNPLLDIPVYLGIKYLNNYPRLLVFLWSLPGGICVFFVYKLGQLLFPGKEGKMYVWLAVLLGCSGSMFLSQIGICTGEVINATLLTISVYLFFRWLLGGRRVYALAFFSALITGAAVGMKLTAAPFVVALTAVFCGNLWGAKKPWKQFGWFALGGVCGFLLTNGYFMMRLWIMYQNPFFPFLNGIFQSPFFEQHNWVDLRFFPRNLQQWIFYPFFWMNHKAHLVTEFYIIDPRFAFGYIAVLGIMLRALCSKGKFTACRVAYSFVGLMCITYVLWLNVYSILRYVVILEILSMVLVVWILRNWTRPVFGISLGILLLATCLWRTVIPDWDHEPFDDKPYLYLFPELPSVPPNSMVIFFGQPMSYVAPFFPQDTQFVGGIRFDVEKYPESFQKQARQRRSLPENYFEYRLDDQIKAKIENHPGSIYIMAVPWLMMLNPITLEPYGLWSDGTNCRFFNANINKYSRGWQLCQVYKISDYKRSVGLLP